MMNADFPGSNDRGVASFGRSRRNPVKAKPSARYGKALAGRRRPHFMKKAWRHMRDESVGSDGKALAAPPQRPDS